MTVTITTDKNKVVILPYTGITDRSLPYTIDAVKYGIVADHTTDNSMALQAAINAAGAAGGGDVWIPAASDYYLFDSATPLSIPSNVSIRSNGARIYQGGVTDANNVVRYVFELSAGASNVMFEKLHLIGAHVSGTTTNWSVGIRHVSATSTNVLLIDCIFENLVGFPFYGGDGDGCIVEGCQIINCGGGFNINNKSARIIGNYFSNCQGLEASGNNLIISNNVFRSMLGTSIISAGGFIQASHYENNLIITNNSFYDFAGSYGIIVAEDVNSVIISNNVFSHFTVAFSTGFCIGFNSSSVDYKQRNILISGNIISDIVSGAMWIRSSSGALTNVSVVGNRIGSDDLLPVSDVFYGITCEVPGTSFHGNYIHTAQYCLDIFAANTVVGINDLKSGVGDGYEVRIISPGTLVALKQYGDLDFAWKDIGGSSPVLAGPIVLTPDGAHRYRVGVANDGTLTSTLVS
jgi:hypothetical protein